MADLRPTIAPKSDQLNADDLLGTTLTVKITKVALCAEPDQPVAVYFEGDGGKPYKPGKSMRRVMINAWGDESANYIGRRMTLFRDEKVQAAVLDVNKEVDRRVIEVKSNAAQHEATGNKLIDILSGCK